MHSMPVVALPDLLRDTRAFPWAIFDLIREPLAQGCGIRLASTPDSDLPSALAEGFEVSEFCRLAGVTADDVNGGWHRGYHRLPAVAATYLAAHMPADACVLACEAADWLIAFCRDRHIPCLDIRPAPLRFGRDLYMALRTEQASWYARIEPYGVSDEELRLEAGILGANVRMHKRRLEEAGRFDFSLPADSLVFIGQAPYDASLLDPQGQPLKVDDYAQQIRELAADRPFFHKAHPMATAFADQERSALARIVGRPVQTFSQNAYQLMTCADVGLVGISSGMLQEARWFDCPATLLFKPCVALRADAPARGEHFQMVHFASLLAPSFWHALLTPEGPLPVLGELPSISHHHARQTFDQWWDYSKVLTWQRAIPYESFNRHGGVALRERLDALERRVSPDLLAVANEPDEPWVRCKRWMLARFIAQPSQFGQGQLYQSHEEWAIAGQRPTLYRLLRYGVQRLLEPSASVLEIGCDIGLIGMALSPDIARYTGLENNEVLVDIARTVAAHRGIVNCEYVRQSPLDYRQDHPSASFDLVCALATAEPAEPTPVAVLTAFTQAGGLLLVESQGSAEPAFDAYLGELLRAGFASLERGLIRDDGKAPRTFCLLRKLHCAEEPNHE